MLSKNQIRYYSSLKRKKFRKEYHSFLAEGDKIVTELLQKPGFLKLKTLLALPSYLKELDDIPADIQVTELNEKELKRISSLSSPNQALLEIHIPGHEWNFNELQNRISFFFDNIQDPGNLGTIVRTADWFGINPIFCSTNSVDIYNPKVIQASMGSISRVKVHYTDASTILKHSEKDHNFITYATIPGGNSIYEMEPFSSGMFFFGNESKGLNDKIIGNCSTNVGIPARHEQPGAESLNLSISAGIIASELLRKKIIQNGS